MEPPREYQGAREQAHRSVELTILMPCLNEVETLADCIDEARGFLKRGNIEGEVLVADNGSTDGSIAVAEQHNARVVHVPVKGYGAALMHGIHAARGTYVIIGDSDNSYDFARLEPYVDRLRAGYDLVMGNRFLGGIERGAMPFCTSTSATRSRASLAVCSLRSRSETFIAA